MQADAAAVMALPRILQRTSSGQLAIVRVLGSEAASVRPADAACSPAFEALLRRAHGYCVCVASRQAGL